MSRPDLLVSVLEARCGPLARSVLEACRRFDFPDEPYEDDLRAEGYDRPWWAGDLTDEELSEIEDGGGQ